MVVDVKGILVRVSKDMHRRFRLELLRRGESAQKVLEQVIRNYVDEYDPSGVRKEGGGNEVRR